MSRLGVVVIGRNEGERLKRCLTALRDSSARVAYVDSDSSDGSREAAAALGAKVVHLTSRPFTPSRGRQVGFEELDRDPEGGVEYVQFIDGDCVLHPDWLTTATRYLDEHQEVGAVFGRRREERVKESLFSRLMDIDWDHPPGDVINFGGDSLTRASAVRAAGGWSATTINAEDIDLSFRVRKLGWRITRLADDMTSHDARMSRFGEYWRRAVRAGYGYIEVGLRYREGDGRVLLKRAISSLLYGVAMPLIAVASAIGALFTGSFILWGILGLVLLAYTRVVVVTSLWSRKKGVTWGTALSYAVLNLICKAGASRGILRFLFDRVARKGKTSDHLIVYRDSRGAKAT